MPELLAQGSVKQQREIEESFKIATFTFTKDDAREYVESHNEVNRILKWQDLIIELYI